MLIKKIKLKNFRTYKDFELKFDLNKKATVIRANNSIGKTTLFESIKWILFGDSIVDLKNKKNMVNNRALRESRDEYKEEISYYGEIDLLHEGEKYTLEREQVLHVVTGRKKKEVVKLTYLEDGETKIVENTSDEKRQLIEKFIQSWVNKNMIDYFFLDGERIEKLTNNDRESQKELEKAIISVSKLPVLQNAIETLKTILRDLKREEAKATKDEEIQKLYSSIEDLSQKEESKNEEKEKKTDELIVKKEELKKTDEKLTQINEVKELQQQRVNKENEINEFERRIEILNKELKEYFSKYRTQQLVLKLYKKYNLDNLRNDNPESTIPHMGSQAIDHIINKGICICGTHISEEQRIHLENQKRYQPPQSPEGMFATYENLVNVVTANIDELVGSIRTKINQAKEEHEKLSNAFNILDDIKKKMQEKNVDKIQQLNEEREKLQNEIRTIEKDLTLLEFDIDTYKKENENLERELSIKMENIQKSHEISTKKLLVEKSLNKLNVLNEQEKESQRKKIEKYTNMHFSNIISKDKTVKIDGSYNLTVLNAYEEETGYSSGESIALSVSVILAIIDTHKENLKSNNKEGLLNEKDFFLMLDGPFAVLDFEFAEAIAKKITKELDQIVLLTNDNQYNGQVKNALLPELDKEYILSSSDDRKDYILNTDLREAEK